MQNYILTDSDILEQIKDKIQELILLDSNPNTPEWITKKDACKLLDISVKSLYTYSQKGLIGYSKCFGKNYYKSSDIFNELNKNYLPPFARS